MYSVFCRTENCGIASTISSGGGVCSKRLRIVGSRLPIRSGIVVNDAMTREPGDDGELDSIYRINRACPRPQNNEYKNSPASVNDRTNNPMKRRIAVRPHPG